MKMYVRVLVLSIIARRQIFQDKMFFFRTHYDTISYIPNATD